VQLCGAALRDDATAGASIVPDWYGEASMPAKATSADLEWKRHTSPISAMSCGPRDDPTPLKRLQDHEPCVFALQHNADMATGRDVDIKILVLTEIIPVLVASLLLAFGKGFSGHSANTFTVQY
jgi:hypothetical protein